MKDYGFERKHLTFLRRLRKPHDIQIFLDGIKYKSEPGTISPRLVLERSEANCFEGALFAAATLRVLGHRPLIVDMIAENDDDHVIALFKEDGCYGAVAKSNTTMLRYREPVYRSLRELVMSYFDFYVNVLGEKTLRSYSKPTDLSKFDEQKWMTTEENLDFIGDYLNEVSHTKILSQRQIRTLSMVDKGFVKLCFSGAVEDGLYKPKNNG